jgi:hypothetical protein
MSFHPVPSHPCGQVEANAKKVLCTGITLLGGASVPIGRVRKILRDASTGSQHKAEASLGSGITTLGEPNHTRSARTLSRGLRRHRRNSNKHKEGQAKNNLRDLLH